MILAAGLVAAGCGGARGDPVALMPALVSTGQTGAAMGLPAGGHSAKGDVEPSHIRQPRNVPDALRFTLKTLDGAAFDGRSLVGRPVVLWFWAPWCPVCHEDAPGVRQAAMKYRHVTFVGMAGLDKVPAMKDFVRRTGLGGIVHLADEKGAVWSRLGVTEVPTYFFVNADGSTTKISGPLDSDELDAYVGGLR